MRFETWSHFIGQRWVTGNHQQSALCVVTSKRPMLLIKISRLERFFSPCLEGRVVTFGLLTTSGFLCHLFSDQCHPAF